MPIKINRDAESIEDALRVCWTKRVSEENPNAVNAKQFAEVLADTLKKLQVAPPNQEWYAQAFRNFDLDKDGWIIQEDVVDIAVQYVNAYLQLNQSSKTTSKAVSGAGSKYQANQSQFASTSGTSRNNKDAGGDFRPFQTWLKDMCWKSFCFVDSESTGKINRSQMKTAMTMVFEQLQNVTMPPDNWFTDAFTNFDTDRDGYLTFDELVEILDQYCEALRKGGVKVQRKPDGGGKGGAKDKNSIDNKLCVAAKALLAQTDPNNTGRVSVEQNVELIKKLWKAVPDMGRQPSTRWCREAFTNFDVKKAGYISVESWCEIVRQYAWWKLKTWPEGFNYKNIQEAQGSLNLTSGPKPHPKPKPTSNKKPGANKPVGPGTSSAGGGIMEAVHMVGHIVVPTYSGKLKVFDDYEFLEKKGEGAFGKVMTVRHNRTGIMRACKSIALKSKDQTKLVETEIELMKQLDHPNILRLYETYYDGDTSIYLVTELCNGGSLFDRLIYHMKTLKRPMSERQSGRYIQQIMQALAYCHSMGIIHRDVKPDNVLFVNRKADSAVKVIDFGLSDFMKKIEQAAKTVKINKDKEKIADGIRRSLGIAVPGATDPLLRKVMPKAGTPHYMPPEMHHKAWYDEKADVFACGVMLYQMLTGIHPFFIPGKDNAETAKQKIVICKVDYPSEAWNAISPLAKQLTQAMLAQDPKERLSSFEALKHKWFGSSKKVTTELRGSVVEGLTHFQQHNKLKQAVLRLLAKEVDEEGIAELREQFVAMDTDGDGILQLEEVLHAAEQCKLHISKKELEQTLFALHGPQLGEAALEIGLNYRDFIASLLEKKVTIERGHLMEIFKRFEDPKEPGYITTKSIKDSMKTHKRADGRRSITESEFSAEDLQEVLGRDTKLNFSTFLQLCYGGQISDAQKGK